jgi:hypothetical protein
MIILRNHLQLLISITIILIIQNGLVNGSILSPPYFNLVANKRVVASDTCGEGVNEPELFCKLTGSTATDRGDISYSNLIQVNLNF